MGCQRPDQVGEENEKEQLKDYSIVTFKHRIGNKDLGTIGIIGPKRMDYENVMDNLKTLRSQLDGILNKSNGDS